MRISTTEICPCGPRWNEYYYDARGRLCRDTPTGDGAHDYLYAYDQGGNRLRKVDAVNDRWVEYAYDVSPGVDYGTFNNRLMEERAFDTAGPPSEPGDPGTVLSRTWYYYNCGGNVTRVVRNAAGSNVYTANADGVRQERADGHVRARRVVRVGWAGCVPCVDELRSELCPRVSVRRGGAAALD